MVAIVAKLRRVLWRRPLLFLAAGLLLALVSAVGVHLVALRYYQLAQDALERRDLKAARADLQICQLVWPLDAETLFLAARIERLDGKLAEAERYLNQLKKLQNGTTARTQTEWTLLRVAAGNLEEAEEAGLWRCVAANDPDSAFILETLVECYLRSSNFPRATESLDKLLALAPDNPRALDWRAFLLIQQDAGEAALPVFQHLVRVAPHYRPGRLRYLDFALSQNSQDEAWEQLEALCQEDADDPKVQLGLARYYFLANDYDKARPIFDRLAEQQPNSWEVPFYRARLERQDNNPAEAERWAHQAVALEPSFADVHHLLFLTLKDQPSKKHEAEVQLQRYRQVKKDGALIKEMVLKRLPREGNRPDVYADIGAATLRVGLSQEGLMWLNKALSKDPNHKATHTILARYYEEHRQPELAARHKQLAQ